MGYSPPGRKESDTTEYAYINLVIDRDAYRSQAGSVDEQSMLGVRQEKVWVGEDWVAGPIIGWLSCHSAPIAGTWGLGQGPSGYSHSFREAENLSVLV